MEQKELNKVKEVMDLIQDMDLTSTARRTISQKNLNEAYKILEKLYEKES